MKFETLDRVRATLFGRQDIVEKRMVGGVSFTLDGRMCCGVTGAALMVRVRAEERERALAEPNVRPMTLGGRTLAGFVCVEPAGLQSDAELSSWIDRGINHALGLAQSAEAPASKDGRRTSNGSAVARSGEARFAALASELAGMPGVTLGSGKRGFGSGALQVNGRIFAMVTRGDLVLKLPAPRVAELVEAGEGRPFEAGRGRPMKEWLVAARSNRRWRALAEEARAHVGADSSVSFGASASQRLRRAAQGS